MSIENKKVLTMVKRQSEVYQKDFDKNKAPTTESVAIALGLTRTVVSRELNKLFKQHLLIKVNTRPVCFILVNRMLRHLLLSEYKNLVKFENDYKKKRSVISLHKIIGWNGSLKKQVEQIKASLMYPEHGLPVIIFGQSGTGKSYFVKCAYNYAVDREVLSKTAPFITINCAQYADNPELLSSILFGYVKGAFTGAVEKKSGALKKADGGILFLDEVHRLSAEGQEKLFTYMDSGTFSPLGDDARKIKSSARLMFATTVNKKNFLETFLRRVPIRINMPSLQDRNFSEKKQLINNFITTESERIKKPIELTKKTINILYRHNYTANVGEAKNLIKSIIATSYANQLDQNRVKIFLKDLPAAFYNDTEQSVTDKIEVSNDKPQVFWGGEKSDQIEEPSDPVAAEILQAWNYIEKMDKSKIRSRSKYIFIVKNLMNHLFFSIVRSDDAMFTHTITEVRNILKLMQYGEEFYNNNFVYGIAVYIYYILNGNTNQMKNIKVSRELIQLFSKQYMFMQQMQIYLEKEFEVNISNNDILWIAIMLSEEKLPTLAITGIIMAHGYATASSITNTVNEMLSYPVFHAIDMVSSASAEDMSAALQGMLRRLKPLQGTVIMIDMGSLSTIAKHVVKFFPYSILLIDKVSTPVAIEVGNRLKQGESLINISKNINHTAVNCTFLNAKVPRRNIIISTCMTGVGTAEQIQKLLWKSFEGIIKVEVITCEFNKLQDGLSPYEKEKYNIVGIIGVDDPKVPNIPYLGLEDIISGNKMRELQEMLSPVATSEAIRIASQQLIKNFSLNRVMDSLTIVSPEKVMPVLEKFLMNVQNELVKTLPNKKQIALYVHLGSMIERLVRGGGIKEYKGNNSLIIRDHLYSVLKRNVSVIENSFMIKVNAPELAYIREIIVN